MTLPKAELVLDARNETGESPVWSAAEQALYWVDIPAAHVHRWSARDGAIARWHAPEAISCLAPTLRPGTWLAGAETGVAQLNLQADAAVDFKLVVTANHAQAHMRFNDGKCDRQGRFLSGTMVWDGRPGAGASAGAVHQLTASGELHTLLNGFKKPNGLAFSPDGRTMYLSDSHPDVRAVWAFDYDSRTGVPSNQRSFIDMSSFAGRPDGATVDTDGCYWICGTDAGRVYRYTPQGVLDQAIEVPVAKPSMCAFGGADLHTLYITSMRPAQSDKPEALDGGVFAIHLSGAQGIEEPSFAAS
jgi:sugar lactone lactonase YvrE